MKLQLIATLLLGCAAAAAADTAVTPEKFTVREMTPEQYVAITDAHARTEAAVVALKKAEDAVEAAQSAEKAARDKALGGTSEYESSCTQGISSSGGLTFSPWVRGYRRVEIRGRYLLISEGTEGCGYLTTGTNVTGEGTIQLNGPGISGSSTNLTWGK